MANVALRTSLIWHDEVMADVVHDKPATVTVGTASDATFTTPDLKLPASFAIARPGRRGYLLTLSDQMSGTICIGGVEHEVSAFVKAGDEGSGFRGTQIGDNDWGVIALDASGDHKFYFQFVPHEDEDWNLGHPMILAGLGGFLLSVAALTAFWWNDGLTLGEAAFRGGSLASLAIGLAAVVRWTFTQDTGSRASLAFSVLLHTAVLFLTFQLYERADPNVWPGPNSLTANYIVARLDDPEPPKPETKAPTVAELKAPAVEKKEETKPMVAANSLPPDIEKFNTKRRATIKKNDKAGAKGEGATAGVLGFTEVLDGVGGDRGLGNAIDTYDGLVGNETGPGAIEGLGDTQGGPRGKGPVGKHEKAGKGIDTGGVRACLGSGCGSGGAGPVEISGPSDPGPPGEPTLTKEEIDKVMKSRQGLFKFCFQKQVDQTGAQGGDLLLFFSIGGDGKVNSSRKISGSISGAVSDCVKAKLTLLKFPAKGGANVKYPFNFDRQ